MSRDIHFLLGDTLYRRLLELQEATGRSLRSQVHICLKVILPIAQAEKRYHLTPTEIDLEPKVHSQHVLLQPEEYDFLVETSSSCGLLVSELIRQYLWVAVEFHELFGRISLCWAKEEFQRQIKMELEIRWTQIQ